MKVITLHFQNTLRSFLEDFTQHGAYIQDLTKFEQEVISQSCCYGNESTLSNQRLSQGICQTYQAFSRTVSNFLNTFRKELTSIEKLVIKQGKKQEWSGFMGFFSQQFIAIYGDQTTKLPRLEHMVYPPSHWVAVDASIDSLMYGNI